ncbi:MAG: DUF1266 domain-containing protein [Defluviitaleaceae bacterium]|nr:DUF1266 domain-containing protein [Defluviitaleaceae bacterium]
MKKIIVALFSAILVLSGCGGRSSNEVTDTIRWFYATHAVLTTVNNDDINMLGGSRSNLINRALQLSMLEDWWGVTNREEADETIEWLLSGGHNQRFIDEYYLYELETYTREELLRELEGADGWIEAFFINLHETYEIFGDRAILGWDLSRANSLFGWFYIAGLIEYEEALDGMLMVSRIIQENFNSWDEFWESYMRGFLWWNEEDPSDQASEYQSRRRIYEDLKLAQDSPFLLDFNMDFEVDWR